MRPRTFLIIIVVIAVIGLGAVLAFRQFGGSGAAVDDLASGVEEPVDVTAVDPVAQENEEPGLPPPMPTPEYVPVVYAKVDLPVGERIRREIIGTELRPNNNVALLVNDEGQTIAYTDVEDVLGQIVKVPISQGQEILRPMLARSTAELEPSGLDLAMGSDLSLLVEPGQVAIAFPIDQFTGVAYALRPGDKVDVMMTLQVVDIDSEFNTSLPNITQRVIESALLAGGEFLFPESTQGRLEFITDINQVVEFVPREFESTSTIGADGTVQESSAVVPPIPKRVTQLTVQQAKVMWVGTWRDPREFEKGAEEAEAAAAAVEAAAAAESGTNLEIPGAAAAEGEAEEAAVEPEATPAPERYENKPDVIILSLSAQDALVMKWALERGIKIDLALRAQGDTSQFSTVSISLPQIIEQGGLAIPEPGDFDLQPRVEDVPVPSLPPNPPVD